MKLFSSLAVAAVFLPAVALAADAPRVEAEGPQAGALAALEEQLRRNPDDLSVWNQYMASNFPPLLRLGNVNPDEAQKRVEAMRRFLNSLQPTQDETKKMLARARWTLGFREQRIRLVRMPRGELEARLEARPDDGPTISQYAQKVRMEVLPLVYSATDLAEESLKAAKGFLDGLRPRIAEGPAKKAWDGAVRDFAWLQHSIDAARQAARLARTPRVELEARLNAKPDEAANIAMYGQRLWIELGPLAAQDPACAEQTLASAKAFLEGLRPNVKEPSAKSALEGADQSLSRLQGLIDRAGQRAALIGKDAAPLDVEAWINGDPLTADDLKGKVVLLDFWAVWFGPSLAALPRLREWHDKYADKGLVIIGLTRYSNYVWDPRLRRPVRAFGQEKVAPLKEREMLAKFAERHQLRYRIAIQKGSSLADYYVVHRIPHVVLIDREGKIRLIRAGGDPKHVTDIQPLLEQLVADGE